jgi:hypothetical protein
MTNIERKMITATLGETYTRKDGSTAFLKDEMNWDGATLDEMANRINRIRDEYGATYTDIRISKETVWEYGEERIEWVFTGRRMETEEECAARVTAVEKNKSDTDARNHKEFERLKSLLGK